jgi:hypothetical protein
VTRAEGEYIVAVRQEISPLVPNIPGDVDDFIEWFEKLRETGRSGRSSLPWLADKARRQDMLCF